ncbi:MAG TPA: hypothetical protein VKT27_04900 [Candidatus Binataceae bacterium]|nr:hypothetical protein [Candidatus Binataceae bacterium]
MRILKELSDRTWRSERGQTLTEYSIIMLLVAVAAYSAYEGLGLGVKAFTGNILTYLSAVVAAL